MTEATSFKATSTAEPAAKSATAEPEAVHATAKPGAEPTVELAAVESAAATADQQHLREEVMEEEKQQKKQCFHGSKCPGTSFTQGADHR